MQNISKNIDDYIKNEPKDIQKILQKIRLLVKKHSPKALEDIKYGIPTFVLNNKNLIHFAAFKKHIGLYPTPPVIIKFKKELSEYKTSKGAIQFPLEKEIQFELIEKIIKSRIDDFL
jgi:uncharacterized protein YdhG (YjbR/CyaY superfamily)